MYLARTKKEFEAYFKAEELPAIRTQEADWQATSSPHIDKPLRREWWNNLIDSLLKDRALPRKAENWCCPW